jgi:uncharacterized protein (DUF1800 family)
MDKPLNLKVLFASALAVGAAALCVAATPGAGPGNWVGDLSPIAAEDWNYERAAHLLERAGFGGTPDEIEALAALSPQDAVRRLVRYQDVKDADLSAFVETGIYPAPNWTRQNNTAAFAAILVGRLDKLTPDQQALLMDDAKTGVLPEDKRIAKTAKQSVVDKFYYWSAADTREAVRLETWMADRMLRTRRPLQEKLVLFWHGHFATGNDKVRDYRMMKGQFDMLRDNANGNLRNLLVGIGKDPAMLIYLDNRQNYKGHPNENFAREILELFSLGVGNYTEKDIKEAARSFTGWSLDGHSFGYMERPTLHDDGEKTFLGKTGKFKGEDIIDIILDQPACSHFIARKLYRFFGREDFSKELEDKLAASLVRNKYEIAPFLEQIFLSKDFYSPATYATQIKSPVQLVVSTYKKLGIGSAPTYPNFAALTGGLGQAIFYPPNVKGWDGGKSWINPATIFQRENTARYILFPEEMPVVRNAHLEGSRRLSGEVIHEQFLTLAAKGNYTDFPSSGSPMANNVMAADPMMKGGGAGSETMKLSGEDFNLFRGVFNGAAFAAEAVPPDPRKDPQFDLAGMLNKEGVTDAPGVVDAFMRRFLRVRITGERREDLVAYCLKTLRGPKIDYKSYTLEKELREVLHLILSAPEYQLS